MHLRACTNMVTMRGGVNSLGIGGFLKEILVKCVVYPILNYFADLRRIGHPRYLATGAVDPVVYEVTLSDGREAYEAHEAQEGTPGALYHVDVKTGEPCLNPYIGGASLGV